MSPHGLLCKVGIHEWSHSSRNISPGGKVHSVRACWCCGFNQTTYEEPDLGCDSPGGIILGLCNCAQCEALRFPKSN